MSLELDRFVDVEDDPDAIVQKLNETVKARKEKLDALMRLEDKIDEMEAQQTETHESGDAERSKNTVAAVLRNIRQLDDKIQAKIRCIQDGLSGEMKEARDTQKCYESYVPHEEEEARGQRLNALQ